MTAIKLTNQWSIMQSKETPEKIWAKIVTKASSDPKFKEKLLKHPENVLKDHGIEVPKGHRISIHEDNETTTHIIINRSQIIKNADLKLISGGTYSGWGGVIK